MEISESCVRFDPESPLRGTILMGYSDLAAARLELCNPLVCGSDPCPGGATEPSLGFDPISANLIKA
jgi:hypothetical protein